MIAAGNESVVQSASTRDDRRLDEIGSQVARVVHELSSPLSLISGSLQNLDRHFEILLRFVRDASRLSDVAKLGADLGVEVAVDQADVLLAICGEGALRLNHLVGELRRFVRPETRPSEEETARLCDVLQHALRLASAGRDAG